MKRITRIGREQEIEMIVKHLGFIWIFFLVIFLTSCQRESIDTEMPSEDISGESKAAARSVVYAPVQRDEKSEDFEGGAWRQFNEGEHEAGARYFATLRQVPAADTRFKAYDAVSGRVVCCFRIAGSELSERDLREGLHVSASAVIDIMNKWGSDDIYSGVHVYELVKEGALEQHKFEEFLREMGEWQLIYGGNGGGLLLPEDSEVVADSLLRIGARRFRLQSGYKMLGKGAGVKELYTLLPEGGGVDYRVEIPYGTEY